MCREFTVPFSFALLGTAHISAHTFSHFHPVLLVVLLRSLSRSSRHVVGPSSGFGLQAGSYISPPVSPCFLTQAKFLLAGSLGSA